MAQSDVAADDLPQEISDDSVASNLVVDELHVEEGRFIGATFFHSERGGGSGVTFSPLVEGNEGYALVSVEIEKNGSRRSPLQRCFQHARRRRRGLPGYCACILYSIVLSSRGLEAARAGRTWGTEGMPLLLSL